MIFITVPWVRPVWAQISSTVTRRSLKMRFSTRPFLASVRDEYGNFSIFPSNYSHCCSPEHYPHKPRQVHDEYYHNYHFLHKNIYDGTLFFSWELHKYQYTNSHLQKLHLSLHALTTGAWQVALSKTKSNRSLLHKLGCSSTSYTVTIKIYALLLDCTSYVENIGYNIGSCVLVSKQCPITSHFVFIGCVPLGLWMSQFTSHATKLHFPMCSSTCTCAFSYLYFIHLFRYFIQIHRF